MLKAIKHPAQRQMPKMAEGYDLAGLQDSSLEILDLLFFRFGICHLQSMTAGCEVFINAFYGFFAEFR